MTARPEGTAKHARGHGCLSTVPFIDQIQSWCLTWLPILLMGALVYLIWRTLKSMPRTKPQQIRPEESSAVAWEDVAGCDEAKHELREVVEFLRNPERFKKLGATVPKGILLHGPPGTGKTMLAKAVANESGAHFFSQSASSFVEMFAGLGAARIRNLFKVAQKHAPAIIFIDELDAIGLQRGFDLSREKDQTLNQLLVEMDGFQERTDLIVIAASNRVDGLDVALLRPGRFDRQVLVSPPDLKGREEILQGPHAQQAARRTWTSAWSRVARPASVVPTCRTSATRPPSSRAGRAARRFAPSTSTARSSGSSPASRRSA